MKNFYILLLITLYVSGVKAQAWSTLSTGLSGGYVEVNAFAVYNSELYVAGEFNTATADGSAVANIAKWNGTSWSAVGTGITGGSVIIHALAVYNGELYAGGAFYTGGGTSFDNICKWNGTTWSAVGTGTDGIIRALTVYNGELYAGGGFSTAGFIAANNIAKWDGINWSAVDIGMSKSVYALAVYNSELYAGGYGDIAKWNGTGWSTVGNGTYHGIRAFTIHNSTLYAGGTFKIPLSTNAGNYIAKWDGISWSGFATEPDEAVYALASYNGLLYAAGKMIYSGGVLTSKIAKWNGTAWSALGSGTNNWINALTAYNGALYAGGTLTAAGGIGANRIAKWTTPVGIEEYPINNGMAIYPNPFNQQTTISFNQELKNATLKIIDVLGKEVRSINFSGNKLVVEKEELKSGIYFLQVISENKMIANEKIVIQ